MAINYQKFFQPTVLTLVVAGIYAVPTSPTSNLLRGARVRLTNTTNTPKTARLYAVPASDIAGDNNAFFFDETIPAQGYIDIDVPILAAGDSIQGNASATPGINIQAITGGVFSA